MATRTSPQPEGKDTTPEPARRIVLPIEGMTCASCVGTVQSALERVPGVNTVAVNLATETAAVSYAPREQAVRDMTWAVKAVGYRAG